MKCPSCSRNNRDTRQFCAVCGAQIVVCCNRCGFGNLPDESYCGGCGISLEESSNSAVTMEKSRPGKGRGGLSPAAVKELNAIKERTGEKPVEESKAVSQNDIDQLFNKK